ncbi:MAG: WYL domain-containing protein [Candidatus Eisenbacteria bacterium]|nr:WYL domain-containing protein [Candidatus Latescibacterota bacterium]MBD3302043.1 WYL domain-containing protein [Candidatus Eisenbacteria bacterium]
MTTQHPPILRILRIHRLIQAKRHPNVSDLARLLEVSRSTVQRDIEQLRDRFGAPVAFNPIENGYEYSEEGYTFPDVEMTEGEALALMVADRALAAFRGTGSEALIRRLLRKAVDALEDRIEVRSEQVIEADPFLRAAPPDRIDPEVFSALEKAVRDRESLEIVLRTGGRADAAKRRIDPYHLVNIDGDWTLLAQDHRSREMRVFKPARIRAVEGTGVRFVPRAVDPGELLRDKIDTIGRERIFEAVLRFDATLAPHILERRWGPAFRAQIMTDGGVELSFRSENADAVVRWCLGWGPGAEVVSPPWVRRRARQILRQIGRRYEGPARRSRPRGTSSGGTSSDAKAG